MAQWNCMKKYPDPSSQNESEIKETSSDLEFPIAQTFDSRPPQIEPQLMLARIVENIQWRNSLPGAAENRRAKIVDVEFVL
jgi:hypothetical protein